MIRSRLRASATKTKATSGAAGTICVRSRTSSFTPRRADPWPRRRADRGSGRRSARARAAGKVDVIVSTSRPSKSAPSTQSTRISSRCASLVGAELVVLGDLEVVVREPPVLGELLRVAEVVAVADLEVGAGRLVDPHLPPGRGAERRPAHERPDRPGEVVVQARDGDVRGRVRVVDRRGDAVLDDRLARVELPAEEGVHEPADRHDLVAGLGGEEVVVDLVAVVHRPVRLEVHHHRLGADREAAREDVEVLDRRLQVHQPLAGGVVDGLQLRRVADPRDADPLAAVERLHVERVADLRRDLLEVEGEVVPLGGRLEARVLGRALVRDQPRLRHVQAEPHHRAVGRVLLHRLERERVVQEVDVVHQRDLLQPLARDGVPPAEPVDHERVAGLRAQVERLVRDPLGRQLVRLAAVLDRADLGEQVLERARPVLLGAEQESDQMRAAAHRKRGR